LERRRPVIRRRPIYAETYQKRQRLIWLVASLAALLILALGITWWLNRNPRPNPKVYPVMGVRLDQSDGAQDFTSFPSDTFVYLKATEGASYLDDEFAINYDRAIGRGLHVGVYHYFSFESTPQAQVAHFLTKVSDFGDLPIGIALTAYREELPSDTALTQQVQTFMTLLQQRVNRTVVLMGTPSMLAKVKTISPHVARWVISAQKPKTAVYWQYSNAASLPGTDSSRYQSAVFMGSQNAFAQQTNKTVR